MAARRTTLPPFRAGCISVRIQNLALNLNLILSLTLNIIKPLNYRTTDTLPTMRMLDAILWEEPPNKHESSNCITVLHAMEAAPSCTMPYSKIYITSHFHNKVGSAFVAISKPKTQNYANIHITSAQCDS